MSPSPNFSLSDLKFCVFDLETTGSNQKTDQIIEIGLIHIDGLKITHKEHFLFNPQKKIPSFIQKLTSISQKDVAHYPTIDQSIENIERLMEGRILVAHNASFDIPFFNSILKRLNRKELPNKVLCTNLMTRHLIPNLLNSNLKYMSDVFGLEHKRAHRAIDDALATAQLLLKYLDIFAYKKIPKVNHLYYPRNKYELDRLYLKGPGQQGQLESIRPKIHAIPTPFLARALGPHGEALFCFPAGPDTASKEYVLKKLQALDFQSASIRLFGSLIESLIQWAHFYHKADSQTQKGLILGLQEFFSNPIPQAQAQGVGDFIITRHLVPQQLTLFPLSTVFTRPGLVFRYPGHEKKLIQFIQAKAAKGPEGQKKKSTQAFLPLSLIGHLLKEKNADSQYAMAFSKELPLKSPKEFFKQLNEFASKNPFSFHYPRDFI